MINFICFMLLLDSKVDYKDYCKSCHGDAKSFYSGIIKTKDLPNTVDVMMKNYGQEIYSKITHIFYQIIHNLIRKCLFKIIRVHEF